MKKNILICLAVFPIFLHASSSPEDCSEIKSDDMRLKCYDSIFIKPITKVSDKDIQSIGSEKNEKIENKITVYEDKIIDLEKKESEFGLSQKQLELLQPQSVNSYINSQLKNATKLFTGKYRFELANQQVWESYTALARHQSSPYKKNKEVQLKKSQMGSYWIIDTASGKRVKVKRVK